LVRVPARGLKLRRVEEAAEKVVFGTKAYLRGLKPNVLSNVYGPTQVVP